MIVLIKLMVKSGLAFLIGADDDDDVDDDDDDNDISKKKWIFDFFKSSLGVYS